MEALSSISDSRDMEKKYTYMVKVRIMKYSERDLKQLQNQTHIKKKNQNTKHPIN